MAALLKKVKKSLQNQISSQTQSEKSKNWLDVSLVLLVFLLSDFIKKPSLLGVCFILCGLLLSLQSRLSTFGNTGYDGIYRFLRHPRYLGLACVLVGLLLQSQSLYLFVFTTLLFITYMLVMLPSIDRMRVIEVKFDYKAYQRQVAALLPGWPQGFVPNNSEIINNSQLTLQNVVASKYRPSWRRWRRTASLDSRGGWSRSTRA